jgi:hypothetical protein
MNQLGSLYISTSAPSVPFSSSADTRSGSSVAPRVIDSSMPGYFSSNASVRRSFCVSEAAL